MAETRPLQTNFTAGELSPRLSARVDLDRYANGAAVLQNVLVQAHGGATRRPGSYYVGLTKSQAAGTHPRLIPFVVSNIAGYALELGQYTMRFYRNRAPILSSGTPLELATPWPASVLRAVRFAQSADVMYLCHPDYPPQKLSRSAGDAFTLAPVNFVDGPYLPENQGSPGTAGSSGSSTGTGTPAPPAPGGDTGGGSPTPDPTPDPNTGGGAGGGGGE